MSHHACIIFVILTSFHSSKLMICRKCNAQPVNISLLDMLTAYKCLFELAALHLSTTWRIWPLLFILIVCWQLPELTVVHHFLFYQYLLQRDKQKLLLLWLLDYTSFIMMNNDAENSALTSQKYIF